MLTTFAAGAALAMGSLQVGNILPTPDDFRRQAIHKVAGEADWPFVSDSGTLMCIEILARPYVYFAPDDDEDRLRVYNLDVDIFSMAMTNLGITGVLLPYDEPQQLVKRIAPFVTMGQRLCNQQPGSNISGTEL